MREAAFEFLGARVRGASTRLETGVGVGGWVGKQVDKAQRECANAHAACMGIRHPMPVQVQFHVATKTLSRRR
jgi:hypothetical protein